MIDAAREYRQLGLSAIPVGRDKRPLIRWEPYQRDLPHADQVDEWWSRWPEANIGCVTGAVSGLVVFDADGPDGLASLKTLGTPATTWLSRTGRLEGGWQQFFAHPRDGRLIGNRAGLRPHLDVRGDGGYVILPPSLHASGRRYEWLSAPRQTELAPLSPALLDLLLTPDPPPVAAGPGIIIPTGQRNDSLYRLGRSMVAKGLSREAVTVALLEENRARCEPPLSEHEVRDIAEHVTTQPDRADFRPELPTAPRILGVGLGQFLAQDFPPSEPYIEGILSSDGGGWIGGEEKLGKTYYGLEEGLGLALALPVCGRFRVPVRRRVLFIEEEDGPRRTHTRLRALLRGHGLDPDDPAVQSDLDAWFRIEVWSGFTFDHGGMVEALERAIDDFRPAVCYVDVLRKVTMRDLNKATEASAVLAVLDALRRKYSCIFRVLHHYRKAQGFRVGRGSQEIGGSFVLGAWAENSLFFEPIGRKQGAVRVDVQTKDAAPTTPFRLRIESEGPPHAPTLVRLVAEDDSETSDADDLVLQAVATLPKTEALAGKAGVTITALVEALKKSPKTIRRAIDRLVKDGEIVVTGKATKQATLYGVNA